MTRHRGAALVLLLLGAVVAGAQQPRDHARPRAAGTASLQGRVTTRDADPQPLRRARVTINGVDLEYAETAITADDGSYRFDGLPAGSYTMRASKDPFVATNAGARRAGAAGTPVTLAPGRERRVDIQLPRGAVITGRIQTAEGDPASGVLVTALVNRYLPSVGERRLTTAASTGLTDDRGAYRIYGLPPGEYLISVRPARGSAAGLQVLTDAEIRDALVQVTQSFWSPNRPGSTAAPPRPRTTTAPPRPTLGLTQVFYPGTPFLDRATLVRLGEGEVRSAVDFDLDYVPLANIEGAVSVPLNAERVQITLARANAPASEFSEMLRYATPDSEGRFAFRAVPPGRYQLLARAGADFAGTADVMVTGQDIAGLTIALQPALRISGRLAFEPPLDAPPVRAFTLSIPLASANVIGSSVAPNVAITGETFAVTGLIPGRYRIRTMPEGVRTPIGRWWLKSAIVSGREILDEPLDLQASATDAVLSWSDRASQLSGTVRDAAGAPARAFWVVVFSRDPRSWFFNSRRVVALRPNAEGHYVIRNLPAGEYLVTATSDLEPNEWFDVEALRAMAPGATPLSIEKDETRTLNVIVAR